MQINMYIYGTSFYHKLDIRAKLLFTLASSFASFFVTSWYGLLLIGFGFVVLSLLSVGVKETWLGFKRLAPILFFLFLLSPLQSRAGEGLLYIGTFKLLTKEGLWTAYKVSMRFIAISYAFMLLIETEQSEKIIQALEWYKLPYNVALMLSLVLRYIPYLGSLYEDIRLSMSLRLKEGKRGYPVMPTITALTVAAIKMIPETAAALEERGFGLKERKAMKKMTFRSSLLLQLLLSVMLPLAFALLF